MEDSRKNLLLRGFVIFVAIGTLFAFAAGGQVSNGLSDSDTQAHDLVKAVFTAFAWATAFLPVWSAWFFSSKMKEHLENKEETGQYEPKYTKVFKIVMALIVGIIAAYILIGIIGKVFFGHATFNDSWTKFVTTPWSNLVTFGGNP